jgi:hypothetical protein
LYRVAIGLWTAKPNAKGGQKPLREGSSQSATHFLYPYKEKTLNKSHDSRLAHRWAQKMSKQNLRTFGRNIAPSLLAISLTSIAHAQGTVDFSGATTAMNSFKTFAEYAGAVICFGCLIWAGIRLMSGRFQDAIPGLFGALFGAGVLGWGAGWISSLTGQSVTQ